MGGFYCSQGWEVQYTWDVVRGDMHCMDGKGWMGGMGRSNVTRKTGCIYCACLKV